MRLEVYLNARGERRFVGLLEERGGDILFEYDKRFLDSGIELSPFLLPKGKLAVIDGLEGFLIAESDNVLLICRKDEEHAIRKYVNDAQMQLGDDFI